MGKTQVYVRTRYVPYGALSVVLPQREYALVGDRPPAFQFIFLPVRVSQAHLHKQTGQMTFAGRLVWLIN